MRTSAVTRSAFAVLLACGASGACGSSPKTSPGAPPTPLPDPADFVAGLKSNTSCALSCNAACQEAATPWTCPALADWSLIPHDTPCGSWDGSSPPPVTPGACSATEPTGDALAKTSYSGVPIILPDGRRLAPAGTEWLFTEANLPGGFPGSSLLVPGTRWLVVGDEGYDTNALRVIDTAILRAGGTTSPVVSTVVWNPPQGISFGLAYSTVSNVLYVTADASAAEVLAFDIDATSGKLTQDDKMAITLAMGTLPQALSISPDGKTLLVGQGLDTKVLAFSLDAATYGKPTATIDLGVSDVFALAFDPNDATGNTAYATMWTSPISYSDVTKMMLQQIDVSGAKATTIPVGQAPESIVFLDARYAVVANALTDSLSVVDRPAATVAATVPIAALGETHGAGPSVLAYDPPRNRLYAALSSLDGIAAFDVATTGAPPTITLAGVVPTAWWPTSLAVDPADGTLYITNGKGHGSGTDDKPRDFTDGEVAELIRGSVQAVPFQTASALTATTATFTTQNQVGSLAGYSSVQCNGAPYDFPVPQAVTDGASQQIQYVFFIERENKTFDDIFGDVPGLDGDPALVMSPGNEDRIWPNTRALGAAFSHLQNYYSDAEQSIQGHAWTVFGRTTDYTERRWLDIWGRGEFGVGTSPGVGINTSPAEGTIFEWLAASNVTFENMGELIGGLAYRDPQWPGGSTSSTIPDPQGACYIAARARVLCNDKSFTFVWLPNDHTLGLTAGAPTPALMIASNDEATGMIVDGISHSPLWPNSLIVITEDDPNTGGDHVDLHRSIALFASPWVKRGYVSPAHYDIASIHKLFAHVFGKPYRNSTIADAPLPLDLFTSTPDYTPYQYIPRAYQDLSCNGSGTTGSKAAEGWDFTEPDNQPGLSQQVWESLRALPPPAGKAGGN